ncbi:MAG: hypothetical protein AAB663_02220 [Patescibacteria group bacterium]
MRHPERPKSQETKLSAAVLDDLRIGRFYDDSQIGPLDEVSVGDTLRDIPESLLQGKEVQKVIAQGFGYVLSSRDVGRISRTWAIMERYHVAPEVIEEAKKHAVRQDLQYDMKRAGGLARMLGVTSWFLSEEMRPLRVQALAKIMELRSDEYNAGQTWGPSLGLTKDDVPEATRVVIASKLTEKDVESAYRFAMEGKVSLEDARDIFAVAAADWKNKGVGIAMSIEASEWLGQIR